MIELKMAADMAAKGLLLVVTGEDGEELDSRAMRFDPDDLEWRIVVGGAKAADDDAGAEEAFYAKVLRGGNGGRDWEGAKVLAGRILRLELEDARFSRYDLADAAANFPLAVKYGDLVMLGDGALSRLLADMALYKAETYWGWPHAVPADEIMEKHGIRA